MSSKKKAPAKSKKTAPKPAIKADGKVETKGTAKAARVYASPETYAKFVKVWQGANSVQEVVEAMGVTKAKVSAWSLRLRKEGVKLKRFRSGPFKIDVGALNEIAKTA